MARARLTIDLDAVAANWHALDALSAASVETAAVLKADAYDLVPCLDSAAQMREFARLLPGRPCALQLDSGMNRLGLEPAELAAAADLLPRLAPVLAISHLACADEVLLLHGEARNFSSVLRCTCLLWLERQAPLAVAAE